MTRKRQRSTIATGGLVSYKKVLQNIQVDRQAKKDYHESLYKSMTKKPHSVHDRQPHFIFSAEQPYHPTKYSMTHEEAMDFLDVRGYNAEEITGKYGGHEKSILVHNPPKHAVKHLQKLASDLGQDSSIVSDGYNHEMHFHHGDSAGKHIKGQGSNFHKLEPEDNYSTLDDGTHFTHNFNWDEQHGSRDSMNPERPSKMQKSDRIRVRPYIRKNEGESHPLDNAGANTKLVHYSPKQGLTSLDSSRQGSRIKDAGSVQGAPQHSMNFFYLEGTKPESIVTSGAKSKYVTSVGDKKLYDRGRDIEGIGASVHKDLKEQAMKRQVNPGLVNNEEYNVALHGKLKDMGYHGIYNSKMDETMKNVVGLFGNTELESEHNIHPNDHKEVSAVDHHATEESKTKAKAFANEEGHHSHKFLHNLSTSMKEE